MILIGSKAIKHWFPNFNRDPKDIDYISNTQSSKIIDGIKYEYLINKVFDNYEYPIMLPNDLYTLKVSHLFWDINWNKHMFDVQFLKDNGCLLNVKLFYKLYEYWNTVHIKNKRSNLEMDAKEFFNNALKEFNHDYLHTLLKDVPTYTKILKKDKEVDVDENLFNNLSFSDKLSLVEEEVMVMAFERYRNFHFRKAYSLMLKKFIINHAPLWEAIFIIENYKVLHIPKYNFIKIIEEKL